MRIFKIVLGLLLLAWAIRIAALAAIPAVMRARADREFAPQAAGAISAVIVVVSFGVLSLRERVPQE